MEFNTLFTTEAGVTVLSDIGNKGLEETVCQPFPLATLVRLQPDWAMLVVESHKGVLAAFPWINVRAVYNYVVDNTKGLING